MKIRKKTMKKNTYFECDNLYKIKYNLLSWDNELVYFWNQDERKEISVNEHKKIMGKLLDTCIESFTKNKEN